MFINDFILKKDNKWKELNISMPGNANLLSNGIKEDTIYALVNSQQKLCEINIKTNSVTWRTSCCDRNYNFGNLYDGLLINTGYDNFIVIGCFYYSYNEQYYNNGCRCNRTKYCYYWYAYSYAEDKWVNLNQWEQYQSYGTSLFFDPTTYHLFYHINGKEAWERVDLTDAKVKDKKLFVEERR